ncbi:nucleoside hydrolase [Tilletiaria anomala UBC 951]|uniref:Nucleoside hydrolase n=1 Tax=Tilletiaria anomala (strain ATCC 24038 / CBS 436.72 / UBC 951) TaxID=1037660 RepID=A0A066W146_TILAU|nr:nucleoside hydrolase [Tilletiaria anomala UBC 951]KDN46263.1 nucleoside hydrolase [Tilletiaria anomala UBC 951]
MSVKPIWLDCDPGHDDAIALLLACHHPRIKLLGVSTVAGNAPGALTFINAARLLVAFGNVKGDQKECTNGGDVPLLRGADEPLVSEKRKDAAIHGEDGLGGVLGLPDFDSSAVRRRMWSSHGGAPSSASSSPPLPFPSPALVANTLSSLLTQRRALCLPPLTICVTGPCTNIALFLKLYSHLATREYIEQVVVMGGSAGASGNRGQLAEFNFLVDPEAARIVCDAPLKVVMAGLNVTHQAIFTPEIHDRLLQRTKPSASQPSPTFSRSSSQPSNSTMSKTALLPPASPSAGSSRLNTNQLLHPGTPASGLSNIRKLVSSAMTFFASTYAHEFGFVHGPPIHDMLVVAYVIEPRLFYTCSPPTTGMGPIGMSMHRSLNRANVNDSLKRRKKKDTRAHPNEGTALAVNTVSSATEADANANADKPETNGNSLANGHVRAYADPARVLPPKRYAVRIDTADTSLAVGASVVDFYNQWGLPSEAPGDADGNGSSWGRGGRNVEVLEEVDTSGLWNLLLEVVDRAEAALA